MEANPIQILNVAGSRCSNAVGVEQFVYEVLNEIVITISS
ncbi:MAG: hypothetical protein V9G16_14140 [Nitrosomonas sp.]